MTIKLSPVLTLVAATIAVSLSGCMTFTRHAVPAYRLPQQFEAPSHAALEPINFAMLGRSPKSDYRLGPGDVIGVLVQGIIPQAAELPPILQGQATLNGVYYPPTGVLEGPSAGLPLPVGDDGKLVLPLTRPVEVAGMTLSQAAESVRRAYVEDQLLKEGRDRVNLTLVKQRVHRVMVLREDASLESANFIGRSSTLYNKRGSGQIIDLPAYESDVLHALAASGGLPGVDAYNEVWVLRKTNMQPQQIEQVSYMANAGVAPEEIIRQTAQEPQAIRIPLKLCPGETIPFTEADVTLQDGDLIYIQPRRMEYFFTGGLLPGAQIPFPRDEDLDIIEAIALANGSVGGFGGTSSAVFRAGAGPGNVIPPRRVLVLRKLPNGEQLPIRVDLARAMKNPAERIRIMPGDFIMMYYTPGEGVTNVALNFLNFSYAIPNK